MRNTSRFYYVKYWNDFNNTYSLCWADKEISDPSFERITFGKAKRLCVAENRRRKTDPSFSGYADNKIYPYEYDRNTDILNDRRYKLNGYVWEREV